MNKTQRDFLSDVYHGCTGDAVFVRSLSPFRCETRAVKSLPSYEVSGDQPLFFSVSSYKKGTVKAGGKGRNKGNLETCSVLHLDFDRKKFDTEQAAGYFQSRGFPRPSYVFKRGDRAHVYYLLDRPVTGDGFAQYETVLKRLVKLTGADALPAQPAALMRVPYTVHEKNGKRGPGYTLVSASRKRYPLSEFSNPASPADNGTGQLTNVTVRTGSAPAGLAGFENILLKARPVIGSGGGRSAALYQFALRCRDFGVEEKEALTYALKFNSLYCSPAEPESVVKHQTASAYRYAKHPAGRYLSEKPERVARKFEEDTRIAETLADFIYAAEPEILINTKNGLRYSKTAQIENALCYASGVKTSLQYVLTFRLVALKDKLAFRPGESHECGSGAVSCYNTYEPLQEPEKTKVRRNDAKVFEDHLKYLTNTPAEFEHLRKFLACAFLAPGKKIKHSLLLISTHEGIGKSVLLELAKMILVSERGSSYVVSTTNTEIARGNNSWIESKFLTFVHELGQAEKFTVLDQLKNWITEPTVRISDKYIRSYEIENYCNFIFFSNAVNALPIGATDRRFFVVVNRKEPQPPEYYDRLLEVFKEGLYSIIEYLRPYADKLNVNAPPPVTDSKLELKNLSRNELVLFLDDCLHDPGYSDFFGSGFTIRELAERIRDSAQASNIRFSQKQAAMWLRDNSFFLQQKHVKGRHLRVYVKDNVIRKAEKFKKGKNK